jgi:hypothetical protein
MYALFFLWERGLHGPAAYFYWVNYHLFCVVLPILWPVHAQRHVGFSCTLFEKYIKGDVLGREQFIAALQYSQCYGPGFHEQSAG